MSGRLPYDLVGEAEILQAVLPPALRCPTQVEWMYDEVELLPGEPPTCVQLILFSNGWEVRLPIRDVHVQQLHPVLPLLGPVLPAVPPPLPQSA